eukprot:gene25299-33829_t
MSQVRSTPPHLTTMINFYSISIFEKKKVVHKELLSSSTSPSDVPTDSANVRLYLNLYFVDRREFLKNIVRSKISKKRRILRAVAKRVVAGLLEASIVEKVGTNMAKIVPEKLELMGLKATATVVYTKSSYICLEVVLHHLDLPTLVSNMSGSPEKGEGVRKILSIISFPRFDACMNRLLIQLLSFRILQQLPGQVQGKLLDKLNAEVEVIACNEEEQGPVLVSSIQLCNAAAVAAAAVSNNQPPVPVTVTETNDSS